MVIRSARRKACSLESSESLSRPIQFLELMLQSLLLQRSKLSCSGAEKLRSLLRCNKQASEPDKLRSLLRCSSKLSRSGACCCNAASKLRSLLRCNSKLSRSGASCCNAASKLRSLLRCNSKLSRSGASCCNAASFHALELGALQGLVATSKLRSLVGCKV